MYALRQATSSLRRQSRVINKAHYSTSSSNDTRPAESEPEQETTATSYLDSFLNTENAFYRDEDAGRPSRSKSIKSSPEDELNQGWGDAPPAPAPRGSEKRLTERALQRAISEKRRREAQPHNGPMTHPEKLLFANIFERMQESDQPFNDSEEEGSGKQNSNFGDFRTNTNEQRIKNFQRRNIPQTQELQRLLLKRNGGMSNFNTRVRAHSPSKVDKVGLVKELMAGSDLSETEILDGLDKAKTEINACQSPFAIWEWARANVWGQSRRGIDEKGEVNAKTDEETASDPRSILRASILPSSEPKFGVHTPFYAPVLRQLVIELRKRFHSPQSALNILRVIKNAGTESVVLGCTPALYAEAIKTSWFAFGDLADVLRLVEEAKATGALSYSAPKRAFTQQSTTEESSEEMLDSLHNDSVIRSLLSNIHSDAYKATWLALAKINALQRSIGTSKGPKSEWQDNMDLPLLLQERFSLLARLEETVAYGPRRQTKRK